MQLKTLTFVRLGVLGLLLTTACGKANDSGKGSGKLPDTSIYHLKSVWKDQDGRSLALSDLRGKTRVVALVFTRCRNVCPRITADMKKIQGSLTPAQMQQVGFTLISIDPEYDTPAVLKAFARLHKLDSNWTLLQGTRGSVRELSAVLNTSYRKTAPDDFSHSTKLFLLRADGTVATQGPSATHGQAIGAQIKKLTD